MLKKITLLFLYMPFMLQGYILITDLGGDIDDVLAIKVAFQLQKPPSAIIATHHKPLEKAKIAKLIATRSGYPQIPVYVGSGCTENDSRETFMAQNPLWPSLFGYLNPMPGEKQWHPQQGKAYRDIFGQEFETAGNYLETIPAHEMLIQTVQNVDSLDIVALGPLHDLYNALITIRNRCGEQAENEFAQKINLWSMGGEYTCGYNWLIAPHVSAYVLKRIKTVCISSNFVRDMNFIVNAQEFDSYIHSPNTNLLIDAIKKDWIYWNKSEMLKKGKIIADPATIYLYLNQYEITEYVPMTVDFPCLDSEGNIKPEMIGVAYFTKGYENRITKFEPTAQSTLVFAHKVKYPAQLRQDLMNQIAQVFKTLESNKSLKQ